MEPAFDSLPGPYPALSVEGLTKAFGVVRALTSVSLEVRAGEVLALMGENGAGKSTLLKLLSGDERPDAGVIRIDGEAHTATTPKETRDAGIRSPTRRPRSSPVSPSPRTSSSANCQPAHRS